MIFVTRSSSKGITHSLIPPWISGSCMSGKKSWNPDATSSKPRPQVALPISVTRRPSASTSPTAVPRRASPTRHWLSLMSASSSPARERRPLTPSARWTRTSTAAWWVRALRTQVFIVSAQITHWVHLWWSLSFLKFQWGSSVYLCYKKSLAKANTIAYKAGKVVSTIWYPEPNLILNDQLVWLC